MKKATRMDVRRGHGVSPGFTKAIKGLKASARAGGGGEEGGDAGMDEGGGRREDTGRRVARVWADAGSRPVGPDPRPVGARARRRAGEEAGEDDALAENNQRLFPEGGREGAPGVMSRKRGRKQVDTGMPDATVAPTYTDAGRRPSTTPQHYIPSPRGGPVRRGGRRGRKQAEQHRSATLEEEEEEEEEEEYLPPGGRRGVRCGGARGGGGGGAPLCSAPQLGSGGGGASKPELERKFRHTIPDALTAPAQERGAGRISTAGPRLRQVTGDKPHAGIARVTLHKTRPRSITEDANRCSCMCVQNRPGLSGLVPLFVDGFQVAIGRQKPLADSRVRLDARLALHGTEREFFIHNFRGPNLLHHRDGVSGPRLTLRGRAGIGAGGGPPLRLTWLEAQRVDRMHLSECQYVGLRCKATW